MLHKKSIFVPTILTDALHNAFFFLYCQKPVLNSYYSTIMKERQRPKINNLWAVIVATMTTRKSRKNWAYTSTSLKMTYHSYKQFTINPPTTISNQDGYRFLKLWSITGFASNEPCKVQFFIVFYFGY